MISHLFPASGYSYIKRSSITVIERMGIFTPQFLVGFVACTFLGFGLLVLLLPRGKPTSRILLSAFFLALGLAILDVNAQVVGFYADHPAGAFWLNGLPLLYGPLLYLLTQSVLYRDFRIRARSYVHFLPFLLFFFLFFPLYHLRPESYQREFLRQTNAGTHFSIWLSSALVFALIGYYLYRSLRMIRAYRVRLAGQYSNTDHKAVRWLSRVLQGFTLVIVLCALLQVAAFGDRSGRWITTGLFGLLFVLLTLIIASIYQGLRESDLFAGLPQAAAPSSDPTVDPAQLQRIENHLAEHRPYLDPDLSLAQLAEQLELPPRELSSLINNGLDRTFFDLINGYRIRAAQHLLKESDDPGQTILEVMYRVGFNSKSSFNTAFKKHTGTTPSQYREQHA